MTPFDRIKKNKNKFRGCIYKSMKIFSGHKLNSKINYFAHSSHYKTGYPRDIVYI